jgi:hypothetical protein
MRRRTRDRRTRAGGKPRDKEERPRRDSNPCCCLERAVSWASRRQGRENMSRAGIEPATPGLKGRCSTTELTAHPTTTKSVLDSRIWAFSTLRSDRTAGPSGSLRSFSGLEPEQEYHVPTFDSSADIAFFSPDGIEWSAREGRFESYSAVRRIFLSRFRFFVFC